MKIMVAVKRVAALDEDFEINDDGRDVDRDFIDWDLNEWDDYSLETAVQAREAAGGGVEVIAVTVDDDDGDDVLRKCVAKGADRIVRVWDETLAGGDQLAVAKVLAAVARREQPDLVLVGTQSSDQANGCTGIALAALLERPHVAVVAGLEMKPGQSTAKAVRELEGGLSQAIEVPLPAVLTIQLGINTPRYASLRGIKQAAAHPLQVVSPDELGIDGGTVGAAGAHSHVRRMYVPEKGRAEMIGGSSAEQAARVLDIIRQARGG